MLFLNRSFVLKMLLLILNRSFVLKMLLLIFFYHVFFDIAQAQYQSAHSQNKLKDSYTIRELVDSGHNFFGETSGNLATTIRTIFKKFGVPNGYLLGEEASGAFIGGITYGEGMFHSKSFDPCKVFWQGPSLGFDFGAYGSRVMMLVYNLDTVENLWGRYGGISASVYLVAGGGIHVLAKSGITLIPVRTGLGARLGINVGYLKVTPWATWNPF